MDNAAKALTIAGEMVLAVLILSLLAYAFVFFNDVSVTYEKSRIQQETQKVNTKFTKYLNEKITAQQLVTVIYTAQDYNKNTDNYKIGIYVESVDNTGKNDSELIDFIKDNIEDKFICKKIEYNVNGVVSKIYFEGTT